MATINKDTWIEDMEIPLIDYNGDLSNWDERIEANTDFVNTVMNGDFTGIRLDTAGLTEQELYALDILKILVYCLPAEQIAVFKHHWEFSNYCGCELDTVCLVHFCDELAAWIFDISDFNDDLSDDNMYARMKNWRSDITSDEYKAVKAYLLGHKRASWDARWAVCWKLLLGSRVSPMPKGYYNYGSNSWLVNSDGEPRFSASDLALLKLTTTHHPLKEQS